MYTRVARRVRRYPCVGGSMRGSRHAAPTRRHHPHAVERAPRPKTGAVGRRLERGAKAARQPSARRVADQHAAAVALVALDRGLAEVAKRHRGGGLDRIRFRRRHDRIAVGPDRIPGIQCDRDSAVSGQRPDLQDLEAVAPLRGGRRRQAAFILAAPLHLEPRRPGVGTLHTGAPGEQKRQADGEWRCGTPAPHRTPWSTMSKRRSPPVSGASG
jgi:hypothetical protein